MFAIAKLTCAKNEKLGATVYNGDTGFYWVTREDANGATMGDLVLIEFFPDDQFAKVIPLDSIIQIVTNIEVNDQRGEAFFNDRG